MMNRHCSTCRCHRRLPADVRFLSIGWTERVVVAELGACWEWNGSRNRLGYGVFGTPWTNAAHRFAAALVNGDIPDGKIVRHRCDNPPCVNPAHLIVGTRSENTQDMYERRRHPWATNHPRKKLSDDQVREIRGAVTGRRGEQAALARTYGVSANQISLIVRGIQRRSA